MLSHGHVRFLLAIGLSWLSKYCIDGLQDAPSDFRMIHGEVSYLRAIVDDLTERDQLSLSLFANGGPLEACHRCLSDFEGLLPADTCQGRRRRRLTVAEIAWPLKQNKARKSLAELSRHKATQLLMISGDIM